MSDRAPLDPIRVVDVVRVTPDSSTKATDVAAVEEPPEIRLHGAPFVTVMRTPGDDRALVAGFLLAEGIVRDAADLGAVEHCRHPAYPEAHNIVDVFLMGQARMRLDAVLTERRHVLANSSCGICGRV